MTGGQVNRPSGQQTCKRCLTTQTRPVDRRTRSERSGGRQGSRPSPRAGSNLRGTAPPHTAGHP